MSKAALDLRGLRDTAQDPKKDASSAVGREHIFTLNYDSPEGTAHQDQVISRVPNGDERIDIARIAAKLAGVQWDHLPIAQAARIWAQSTIAVQLRDPPNWLSQWATEDDQLLFACFEVCQQHETEFFRFSDGEGTEGTEKPRVSIRSTLATVTA